MIISPRAKEVINVLRKDGEGFREINEVLLLRRRGAGSPYRKITYWKREENFPPPPPLKLTSFAIVPEMTATLTGGYAVQGTHANAWQAFNRLATSSGTFGANSWITITFPEVRTLRGWALQFSTTPSGTITITIEGKRYNGEWERLFFRSSVSLVSNGYFGITTRPMECTEVRIQITAGSSTLSVRTCQFFEYEPLVPVTFTLLGGGGVTYSMSPGSLSVFQCFTHQSIAYPQGTKAWYIGKDNKGEPTFEEQNRMEIYFSSPKTVSGFSVGGIVTVGNTTTNYNSATHCCARCLLIEGRASNDVFWRRIDEVEFNPAEQKTQYFNFPNVHTVGQLRITVQDVTSAGGTDAPLHLPPMQVWGR